MEELLGLDPDRDDSDADGFSDGLEHHSGSDPLSARSTPLTTRRRSASEESDDLADPEA